MTYKVTFNFPNDFKDQELASFKNLDDAKLFIHSKLRQDAGVNVVIYKLFDFDERLETFDPKKMDMSAIMDKSSEVSDSGAQGKGSTSGFRPSPFSTTPAPSGTAKKWVQSAEEKQDDEKK